MNDHQTVGEAWDWVRHQPRAGDVFRSKLGRRRDEVELLCFDPLGRDGLGAWRVGYGEHDVISHAALVDLYYPVSRGPDATPMGDLVAFARWWIHNTKIVNTTEAIAACITRVVYGGRDDEKNRQAYAQVRHAIEAIAAYEQARGIKAEYSRSDHMHDVAATDALPEWAKPGQRVRRFGDRSQPRPDPDMVVIAADHGRILIGERSPFGRVPPFVVCAPDFGGWWPVDDKGNPLGAKPRKVTTSAEVDAGMAARGASTKSADIGLAKEAVAELCNEYLKPGERSSGGVARAGVAVAVKPEGLAHPPEVSAKAGSVADAEALGRAFLEADIATLEKMIAAHDVRLDGRHTQVQGELDALREKLAAMNSEAKPVGERLVITRGIKRHDHSVLIEPFANVTVHSTTILHDRAWHRISTAVCQELIVVPAVYVMTTRESMRLEHSAEYLVLYDGVAQEPGNGLSDEMIRTIKALLSRATLYKLYQGPQ